MRKSWFARFVCRSIAGLGIEAVVARLLRRVLVEVEIEIVKQAPEDQGVAKAIVD